MSLRIKTHALPLGYTELQYLQSPSSTSTGNYLDTGKPIQQNATYECKFTLGNTQNGSIMGTRTEGWRFWYLVYSGSFEVPAGNDIIIPQSIVTPTTGTTYVFKSEHSVSGNTFYSTTYIDGVDVNTNTTDSTRMPTTNIWLFGNNKDGSGSQYAATKLRIHYYWIKDTNGNYIQHLVPAKRNSDNKLGMYDIVANTFITTTGADFTAGPEVTTPTKALKEIHELRKSDGQGGLEYIGELYKTTNNKYFGTTCPTSRPSTWTAVECPLAVGATFTVSVKPGDGTYHQISYYNASGAHLDYYNITSTTPGGRKYSTSLTVPANTKYWCIYSSYGTTADTEPMILEGTASAAQCDDYKPALAKIFSAGYDRTVSGNVPPAFPDARAKATTWQIDGQSKQGVLPTTYQEYSSVEDTNGVVYTKTSTYIPAKRISDNVFGLYYISTNTFVTEI